MEVLQQEYKNYTYWVLHSPLSNNLNYACIPLTHQGCLLAATHEQNEDEDGVKLEHVDCSDAFNTSQVL